MNQPEVFSARRVCSNVDKRFHGGRFQPSVGHGEQWRLVWAGSCQLKSISRTARRKLVAALLLSLPVVATSPCSGQESIKDLSEISLEQLSNVKVFTASKHLQNTSEAPSSVTVITADEIQQQGYRTLADILRSVRGFYVTNDRNYSYLGVRGFGLPGDYNTRVLLLIDGHRSNDNIYDQAMLGTEFPLDVDVIARVEVIRGASSSLYGSNAFFAVINVITKKGHDVNGLELSFDTGSFHSYKGRVTYGGEFKGVETLISASFYDSAGQSLFFPEFDSPETNNGITQSTDYDRYNDLLLTSTFHNFTLQAVDSRRTKGIPTGAFETAFNDTQTHSTDQHQYLDLSYKASVGDAWEIGGRTYYDRYTYDADWPYPTGGLNVDYVRGEKWGGDLQLGRTFLQKHRLTFGAELRDNFQQDQRNYDTAPTVIYVDDHRTSWMWAGFVQDEYAITKRLTLNAGLRYDGYTTYGGSTNPRIGLIYRPFQSTSMKLLYGTAFRVPNVYEAYYGTDVALNSLYQLNPKLKPESIRNVEAVWEQGLGKHFQSSVDVFRNYIVDLIALTADPVTGLLMNRNTDRARSTGVEFELAGHMASGLEGRMSYTFTETEDRETNQILVNSPRNMAKLNVTAPLYRRHLFVSIDAQYEDSRLTLAGNHVPAFLVFNTTLLGRALSKHWDLSASIYNLFDRRYFDVAPQEDRQDALRQDGRNVRVTLTWHMRGKQ
jgi:outer membrane receptor for ferrienterochelin and colicins